MLQKIRLVAFVAVASAFSSSASFAQEPAKQGYYFQCALLGASAQSTTLEGRLKSEGGTAATKLDSKTTGQDLLLIGDAFRVGSITDSRVIDLRVNFRTSNDASTAKAGEAMYLFNVMPGIFVGPSGELEYRLSKTVTDTTSSGSVTTSTENETSRSFAIGPHVTLRRTTDSGGFLAGDAALSYFVAGSESGEDTSTTFDAIRIRLGGEYGYRLHPNLLLTGGVRFTYASIMNVDVQLTAGQKFTGDGSGMELEWELAGLRYNF